MQRTCLQWKSLEAGGAPLINDSDIYPCQNVLAQPHVGKAALANGVQKLVMAGMGLLVSRDGCRVM